MVTFTCLHCKNEKQLTYRVSSKQMPKFCSMQCRDFFNIEKSKSNPRICQRCKILKTKGDFRRLRGGHSYKNCLQCEVETQSKQSIVNIAKSQGMSRDTYRKGLSAENFIKTMFISEKHRAKNLNRTFSLELEDVLNLWSKQSGKCALSGIPMTFNVKVKKFWTNISLDRRDSNIGYELDNCQLVCYAINIMKNKMSEEELVRFCQAVAEKRALCR